MLRRASTVALLAAVALAGGSCTCRSRLAGPPPEAFLPAGVELALVVPEAGRAGRELAGLHGLLATFPGAADLAAARGALAAQLGFDPLDPDALAAAGLDPRRGAALGRWRDAGATPAQLLVLPVGDAAALDALLARLARDRLGAGARLVEQHPPAAVTTFRAHAGAPAALAYAIVQGSALVAAGAAAPALVAEAARRQPAASLRDSEAWRAAREALGDRYAAVLFAPPGSPALAGRWVVADGLALGTSAGDGGVSLAAAIPLGARRASLEALGGEGGAGAAAKALAHLDPAAPLAATCDGDPAALGAKLAGLLPPAERARLSARGLDLARDLFAPLAPGAAAVFSLAPELDLTAVSAESVREDPLLVARFEAVLPLADPAAALATSTRLVPPRARGRGAAAEPAAPADGTFRLATGSGEIAWSIDAGARRALVAGGPPGALERLQARLAGGAGFTPPTDGARRALAGGLGAVVVDTQRLAQAVRALPDEAFGGGPTGFVVRSVVERFVDPVARLAAVSARAELAAGALVIRVEVEARREARP